MTSVLLYDPFPTKNRIIAISFQNMKITLNENRNLQRYNSCPRDKEIKSPSVIMYNVPLDRYACLWRYPKRQNCVPVTAVHPNVLAHPSRSFHHLSRYDEYFNRFGAASHVEASFCTLLSSFFFVSSHHPFTFPLFIPSFMAKALRVGG